MAGMLSHGGSGDMTRHLALQSFAIARNGSVRFRCRARSLFQATRGPRGPGARRPHGLAAAHEGSEGLPHPLPSRGQAQERVGARARRGE